MKRNIGNADSRIVDGKKHMALAFILLLSIVDNITEQILVGASTCPGTRGPAGTAKRVEGGLKGEV